MSDKLDNLNSLKRQAETEATQSERAESAQNALADLRKSDRTLIDAIEMIGIHWRDPSKVIARRELHSVINEMAADIYRIAEMRLAAKARKHKVAAAQKRAIVEASILPMDIES